MIVKLYIKKGNKISLIDIFSSKTDILVLRVFLIMPVHTKINVLLEASLQLSLFLSPFAYCHVCFSAVISGKLEYIYKCKIRLCDTDMCHCLVISSKL